VKPTQLRKDLTYLGSFGKRGLGYNVKDLLNRINLTLGTNKLLPVVLVGVGNLGAALLYYPGFAKEGFEVLAAFDVDPSKKKVRDSAVPILGMEHLGPFIQKSQVKLAILTVPAYVAQAVANQLIACGITAILNFSPLVLHVPAHVIVNNVNLAIELENLAYFVR
jgi:redox-sensing transcriptional repressor